MAIVSQVRAYNVAAYHEVKLQGNGIKTHDSELRGQAVRDE